MRNSILLFLLVFICISTGLLDNLMVGKWKLQRRVPLAGPNRCYVDKLSFNENNEFELVFKTLINNVEQVYNYTGKVTNDGNARIALGDSIAYLNNFDQVENSVDFRFEYGEKLGMFCTRAEHPYPHKHLPHDLKGQLIK